MFDIVKTTGKIVTQDRDVKNFTCIYFEDKIDVYITQDTIFKVQVEAGSNLQSLIKTELEGETLKVHNNNRQNWVRGYKHRIKIYISAPYFKHLENNSVGTIRTTNTINQNEISIRTSNTGDVNLNVNTTRVACSTHGNGNIYLTGTTNRLEGDFVGTNFLYAKDLKILNYIYLHSASIGHAHITAPENGLMDIKIDRDGNIYYSGTPSQINLTRISKGDLIKE